MTQTRLVERDDVSDFQFSVPIALFPDAMGDFQFPTPPSKVATASITS